MEKRYFPGILSSFLRLSTLRNKGPPTFFMLSLLDSGSWAKDSTHALILRMNLLLDFIKTLTPEKPLWKMIFCQWKIEICVVLSSILILYIYVYIFIDV